MRRNNLVFLILAVGLSGCSTADKKLATIGSIQDREIVLEEPQGNLAIDEHKARKYYQEFLSITNDYQMYSQALRRLADLQLKIGEEKLSGEDQRTLQAGHQDTQASIRLYTTYLETHPNHPNNDQILYQLAKAYELDGQPGKSLEILDRIMHFYPTTKHRDEVQFRRGEMLFTLRRFRTAAQAYQNIFTNHPNSIFYEKALYKYGWTQFKLNNYKGALNAFFNVMDRKQQQGMLAMDKPVEQLVGAERELIVDTLRAISLSFAYQHGEYTVTDYFKQHGARPYEALIYLSLGQLHFEKERIKDAADTYMAYVQRNPTSPLAPEFHTEAINAYQKGGLVSLVLPAKEKFVELYGVNSAFWNMQNQVGRDRIKPLLETHITEIATHYHAVARKSKKSPDFLRAAKWYALYIKSFPNDPKTANVNFLMAEALYDGRYYVQAAEEYEKTAYNYPPHNKSAEAGYAALLSYNAIEKTQPKLFDQILKQAVDSPAIAINATQPGQSTVSSSYRQKSIESALRFTERFPNDKRVTSVLAKTADSLFKSKDYLRAASVSQKLVSKNITDPALTRSAWIILGHSEFELGNYAESEKAYRESLGRISNKDKQYRPIYDRLAASIYKQGEQARDNNQPSTAVSHFLRLKTVTPSSSLTPVAQYDAATSLIGMKQYKRASGLLEDFRRQYPKHKLNNTGINEKLALIYSETGQSGRAAREMETLAVRNKQNKKYSADLMWQAATYYEKANMHKDAQRVYALFSTQYAVNLERSLEARQKQAEYARKQGNAKEWGKILQDIIRADANGGNQRTDRTRYLAADATLKLADGHLSLYKRTRLTQPLKTSIKQKKQYMQNTINAYETAIKYRVAEITTSATYQIGELYADFAKSLMNSPPPKGLNAEAIEQYKILLEDQAFPFEEKSIDIHAANVKQIHDGLYDKWVKASLAKLRKLQPARYAKDEKVERYVEAIN